MTQPLDFKTALLQDVLDWFNDVQPTIQDCCNKCGVQCDIGTGLKARIEAALIDEQVQPMSREDEAIETGRRG